MKPFIFSGLVISILASTVSSFDYDSLLLQVNYVSSLGQTRGPELQKTIRQDLSAGNWLNTSKELYNYNDSNLVYQINGFQWLDTSWVGNSRTTYVYNSDSTVALTVLERYVGDTWTYLEKNSFTYDSSQRVTVAKKFQWKDLDWQNSQKVSTTYDGNGNKTIVLSQQWLNNAWSNMFKDSLMYDGNNYLIELFSIVWAPTNEWVEAGKKLYTYDPNGNRIEELVQKKSGAVWENYARKITSYDDSSRAVVTVQQIWETDVWQNSSKSQFTYAFQGSLTEELYSLWEADSFAVHHRIFYFYDGQTSSHQALVYNQDNTPGSIKLFQTTAAGLQVRFFLPAQGCYSISLLNAAGRCITTRQTSHLLSGTNTVTLPLLRSSGIYFIAVTSATSSLIKKFIIVK